MVKFIELFLEIDEKLLVVRQTSWIVYKSYSETLSGQIDIYPFYDITSMATQQLVYKFFCFQADYDDIIAYKISNLAFQLPKA